MHVERITNDAALIQLTRDELDLFANALNEVCHVLEEWEFSTRVGAQKPEALKLFHHVKSALDAWPEGV